MPGVRRLTDEISTLLNTPLSWQNPFFRWKRIENYVVCRHGGRPQNVLDATDDVFCVCLWPAIVVKGGAQVSTSRFIC